jgi:galactokinase
VQAPGRVNLIGEHTDYNDGLVLPCAIDYRTVIAARQARPTAWCASSPRTTTMPSTRIRSTSRSPGCEAPMWANYVRGVVDELRRRGLPVPGMDMAIAGDVPQGAGLSSSASLSVAVCRLFAALPGFEALTPLDMALIAQRAENDFVGCKCGNMDQISSACGVEGHA